MRLENYRLELADGSVIDVRASAHSGYPEIKWNEIPDAGLRPFTAANPPQGEGKGTSTLRSLSTSS